MNKKRKRYNEKRKKYRIENKAEILQLEKEYRKKNKDKIKQYDKKYRDKNKGKRSKKAKKYYLKNKKKILKQQKQYRVSTQYYQNNKEKLKQYNKQYKQKNKQHYNKYINKYFKRRMEEDNNFRLLVLLRDHFRKALKFYTKTGKIMASKQYGINYQTIIKYLQPLPENLSDYHIHHIKPLFTFNFINEDGSTNLEEIKKAFAPENHKLLLIEEHKKINHQI